MNNNVHFDAHAKDRAVHVRNKFSLFGNVRELMPWVCTSVLPELMSMYYGPAVIEWLSLLVLVQGSP